MGFSRKQRRPGSVVTAGLTGLTVITVLAGCTSTAPLDTTPTLPAAHVVKLTEVVAAVATSAGMHDEGPSHGHVVLIRRDGAAEATPTEGIWFARVGFDGTHVLAQDRTTDYAIGPEPFAVKRDFATTQHGILLVEPEGRYSAWFNSGIPPGQTEWRVDVSRGGPPLNHDAYPLMGIHLLGWCAGRVVGLSVTPETVQVEQFRGGTRTPLGLSWTGEPPAGMSKPMPCAGTELVAIVNQGGDPSSPGQVTAMLVRIESTTGRVTKTPATLAGTRLAFADVQAWAASAQHLGPTSLTWGDNRGPMYSTRRADGVTTELRPPLRKLTASEAVHWAFGSDRATLLDEATPTLITYALDGRELSRIRVPDLATLLTSSGERVTDTAAVHP